MTDTQAIESLELVHALAQRLTVSGCDVRADIYEQDVDWSRWGPEMIDECDFTLVVPSIAYRQRWDGRNPPDEGAGAAREINVLKGRFDKNQQSFRGRTVIVMLPGITKHEVPDEIYAYLQRFRVDPMTGEGIEPLIRHLTKQPEFILPPPGLLPHLPPHLNGVCGKPSQATSKTEKAFLETTTTWLHSAASQRDGVSRLARDIERVCPPPSRPSAKNEVDMWLAALANWTDDTSSVVDEIEQVRSLIPRDPSVRFVQVLGDTRAKIRNILDYFNGSQAVVEPNLLADAAMELYELTNKLARLTLEL
jgi:hypothetical protein